MTFGFIGIGHMGSAMFKGALKTLGKDNLCYTDIHEGVMAEFEGATGVAGLRSNRAVVKASNTIVLAIKPQYMDDVLAEIKGYLTREHVLLTLAPGVTINHVKAIVGEDIRVVRSMPNTPALVLEGISAYTFSEDAYQEEEKAAIAQFFQSFGRALVLKEHQLDQVVPVSGSSPAYFFMMLEAMADAAVLVGLPRQQSYELAAQAMLGAAKMVLTTGEHPGALKDAVCSPGGTTIEAVRVLEERGFRSAIIEAMVACYDKTQEFK